MFYRLNWKANIQKANAVLKVSFPLFVVFVDFFSLGNSLNDYPHPFCI